jgi:hypothetical protein
LYSIACIRKQGGTILSSSVFFILVLGLSIGIGLWGLLRCLKGSRLGHFILIHGVPLDLWGLSGVEARVSTLETVADVDVSEFSTLGHSDGSGPPEGADDIHSVGSGALLRGKLIVLLDIAAHLGAPGGFHTGHRYVLVKAAETLLGFVLISELGHKLFLLFVGHALGLNMSGATSLENNWVEITPNLHALKLFGSGHCKLLRELHLLGLLVHFEEALGNNSSCRENTGKLSTEEVSLLSGEWRVAINSGVQISDEDVLDHAGNHDVLGADIGKLNPVAKQIIGDPVNEVVNTGSAHLLVARNGELFGARKVTTADPVILLGTIHLTDEANAIGSRHDCETLNALAELESVFFSEGDASPFEHFSLFVKVRNNEFLSLGEEGTVGLGDAIVNLNKRLQSEIWRGIEL